MIKKLSSFWNGFKQKNSLIILENNKTRIASEVILEIIKQKDNEIAELRKKVDSRLIVLDNRLLLILFLVDILNPLSVIKTMWFYYTKNFWEKFVKSHNLSADDVLKWKILDSPWKRWIWFIFIISFITFKFCLPNRWMKIQSKIEKKHNSIWEKTVGRLDFKQI